MKPELSQDGLSVFFYPDIPFIVDKQVVIFSAHIVSWLDTHIGSTMWERETSDVILSNGETALGRTEGERFCITFKRHEDALMTMLRFS